MLDSAIEALREYDAWSRPDAADAVAEALRGLLADMRNVQATAWSEGHETDEHGRGLCECPNPYLTVLENRSQ